MTTKRCSKCGQEKDLADFQAYVLSRKTGLNCRACAVARKARWLTTEKGKTYLRRQQLRHKFNITLEQYDALLLAQGNVCGICGNECATGNRLAVDHDHVTGQIRGLLCGTCNKSLGGFRDSIPLLAKAAAYLTRPPAREILSTLDDSTTEN